MTHKIGTLPHPAQETLKNASQVGKPGSFERAKAIDRAIEKVRTVYPDYFKKEN